MQNSAPYIETYVNVWCDLGFNLNCLKKIADYCFKNGRKSFEDMHEFVSKLYDGGIVSDGSVDEYIEKIKGGWTDVDVIITQPAIMGKIGALGRVLGPRGLMPNHATISLKQYSAPAV